MSLMEKLIQQYKQIYFNVLFFSLCIIAGVGSASFAWITDHAVIYSMQIFHYLNYGIIFYVPCLFVLIVFLLKRYFPYAGGSGLPQGYALDVYDHQDLHATYSIRTLIGKVFLTSLSLLGGAALGREGPTIQICASIFASLKNISIERKKLLIRIGSGVGVATAFNAPLGGIVFVIEEYLKNTNAKINLFLLSGIGIAGYCVILISGNYSYMGYIKITALSYSWNTILVAIMAGVICGIFGAIYTWLIIFVSVGKNSRFCKWRKTHTLQTACIFGVLIALLGLATHGLSFGNGTLTSHALLNNNYNAPWYFGLSKFMASIFAVAAGVPGGYFSTSLSIGIGIMDIFHKCFPIFQQQQLYLLGMAGFLAAITNAPITAIIMVVSIVGDAQHFVIPIIFSSLIAAKVASMFGASVYHQQVLIYVNKDKYSQIKK